MSKKSVLVGVMMATLSTVSFAASEQVTIMGDHGKLAAVVQRPDGVSKYPIVILSHGFTSNKNDPIMTAMANKLEKLGVASIRYDFNGHGESEGRSQDMTVLNEIKDAEKVYDYAARLKGVTRIGMLGHSQGGVVTSMAAGELGAAKVKAIVLMAPAAVLRDDAIRGNLMGHMYDPFNPPEYIELKELGGFKVGAGYLKTAFNLPIYETAAHYTGPAAMIHGKGDRIAPYTYSERYAQLYPKSALHLLPTADHMFSNPKDLDEATTMAGTYLAKTLGKETGSSRVAK